MDSLLKDAGDVGPLAVLSRFRRDFHACLTSTIQGWGEVSY
jgi:hypothetical protein